MGLWSLLVTDLVGPGDDFRQRLRKSVVGVLFCPCAFMALLYSIRELIIVSFVEQTPISYTVTLSTFILATSFSVGYFWMRRKRHVSDRHMAVLLWVFSLAMLLIIMVSVGRPADGKSVCFTLAAMGLMTQVPWLPLYFAFNVVVILITDWNQGVLLSHSGQELLLAFPNSKSGGSYSLWSSLASYVGPTITLLACAYMFHMQIVESERRGAAQAAANDMTMKVLQRHRKYDTVEVTKILEECVHEKVVDPELIKLFEGMNRNLESYRPFLPNYLFQDHEQEPDGNAVVEEMDGEHPLSSDEDRMSGIRSPNPEDEADAVQLSHRPLAARSVAHGYRGIICQACVELCSNEWFSTRLTHPPFSARTREQQRNTLSLFTATLFDLAQSAKASVHSLIGDTVQLTWNATHRVTQPELKAALFLLRLKQALATALPDLKLAGACCAGHAEVHNTISSNTRQQAMFVDAPWLPALDACYALAKRYKTLVVDANIECGSQQQVIVQGVDCIRYAPQVAVVPGTGEPALLLHPGVLADGGFEPEGFATSTPDHFDTLLGVTGTQQAESAKTLLEAKPIRYTLAFELLRRKAENIYEEDDWLYGGDGAGGKTNDVEPMLTGALMMCVDGQPGQAAAFVAHAGLNRSEHEKETSSTNEGSTKAAAYAVQQKSRQQLSLLGQRLIDFCSEAKVYKTVSP